MEYALTCHLSHEYVRARVNEHLAQYFCCSGRYRGIDRGAGTRKNFEETRRRSGHRGHAEDGRKSGSDGSGIDLEPHDSGDLTQHADL